MNDHICINIPFADQYVVCDQEGRYAFINFDPLCMDIPLASRSVHMNVDGTLNASALFHPYESLPTHYTGMACKVLTLHIFLMFRLRPVLRSYSKDIMYSLTFR